MSSSTSYIPGVCNINKAEIAYRRKAMWFGAGISLLVLVVAFAFNLIWWLGALLLFVPAYIAAINFLQVRNRFCVKYGTNGKQNADELSEEPHEVTEDQAIAADKAKSRRMNLQALTITIVAALSLAVLLYVA